MKHYRYQEADDCFDMAYEWLTRGGFEKAEELLKRAIELNPNFTYAYIALSEAIARQNRFGDAVKVIKRATGVDPEFDRLYFIMAKYSFKRGDFIAALKSIRKASEMNPSRLHLLAQRVIEKHASGVSS